MSPTPVSNAGESARLGAHVLAGGGVLWREAGEGIEVLLIHRPRYGDWSWPKGKVDPGETLPEAAVREIREETGHHVTLGLPLPSARYTVGRRLTKHVSYWAAEVTGPPADAIANPREIDEARWVTPERAAALLTRFHDREQLDKVVHAHSTGSLRAWPLIIVRHGKAFPRAKWHETEQERPLLAVGTRQALALTGLLRCWDLRKLVSSPWKRCVATLKPVSAASGRSIRLRGALSEKANAEDPERTAKVLRKIIRKGTPTALCTHRPVLPTVLRVLREFAPQGLADRLPRKDPFMNPGEILVAYVRPGPSPRIVEFERYRPIDA
ncbi:MULTISPECIES: NUDIX hydrolase [Brevibacterium]|jgi:8-oxo-dGTP pyrophosphatase MutT (NUDIX family)/phosphohistidine phosphatase SixA|uniref:NUDIX hydrolase n=1 Tax=Brevibacterium salitolerans TaxID=1403566 RepID=A0ABP5IQH5_9MICO|nr:NUDIX domain-containing protein [Brevibacterium sp.]